MSILESDIDGFDPFREEHPAHEFKSVGELIPKNLLRAWIPGDPAKPPPRQDSKCEICHKLFVAKAGWFAGKWLYSRLCLDCGDGNTLPPGFLDESHRPPVRRMACLKCGITRNVEGRLLGNLWQYELTCSFCGQRAMRCCRIKRACAKCGEDFFVNERRPLRVCVTCERKSSSSPYS